MPYKILSLDAVAEYLHLTPEDLTQRAKCNDIPHEKRGQRIVFSKDAVDLWASQRLLGLPAKGLSEYHRKSIQHTRESLWNQSLLPELIRPAFIAPTLRAKTKSSVLRELVAVANATGHLINAHELVAGLEARETWGSTGMPGGFALPHPHAHDPYLFTNSFIVLGRTNQEIHFGAPDARPTSLFFLVCCPDDRLHLHLLAHICVMAQNTAMLSQLREAGDAATMLAAVLAAEAELLATSTSGQCSATGLANPD